MKKEWVEKLARDAYWDINHGEYDEARVKLMPLKEEFERLKKIYNIAEVAFVQGVFWALNNHDRLCENTD